MKMQARKEVNRRYDTATGETTIEYDNGETDIYLPRSRLPRAPA